VILKGWWDSRVNPVSGAVSAVVDAVGDDQEDQKVGGASSIEYRFRVSISVSNFEFRVSGYELRVSSF
jgi:hypothetical protein